MQRTRSRREVLIGTFGLGVSAGLAPFASRGAAVDYLTRDPSELERLGSSAWTGWAHLPRFNGVQPLVRTNERLRDGVEPSWRPHCYGALAAADWPYHDVAPLPPGIAVVHRFEVAGRGQGSSGYVYGTAGYGDSAYWGMGGEAVPDPTAPDGWRSTKFDDRMIDVADDLELRERCEWSARHPSTDAGQGDVDEVSFWLYLPRRIVRGDDGPWPFLYSNQSGRGWGPVTIVYQHARDGGAGFMLRDHGDRLDLRTAWQPAVPGAMVVPRERLFDRWIHLRWRTTYHVTTGRLQIWRDGQAIYDERGGTLPRDTSAGYAKFGIYTSYLGRIDTRRGFTSRSAPRRNLYVAGMTRQRA